MRAGVAWGGSMTNRMFGALCALLALGYVFFANQTEVRFLSDPIGPKFFPFLIGGLLAGAGLTLMLRGGATVAWPTPRGGVEIAMATTIMVGYALLLPVLGFVTCSTVVAAYLSWRLGAGLPAAGLAGLVTAVTIFLVFHHVLKLTLAVGPLGF